MKKCVENELTEDKRKVVIFSEIEWGFLKQRHQFLAEYLVSEGYDVEFVQKVPSRVPSLSYALKFLVKLYRDRKSSKGKPRVLVPRGLKLSYSRFLPPSNPLFREFNRRYAAPYHARSLAGGIAYVFTPTAFELVKLRSSYDFKVIFDIIHNWWSLPWASATFKETADNLVRASEAVICDSKPLADHLEADTGRKISLVTPGVSDFWIENLALKPRSAKTVAGRNPRIAFFGNLRENSDIELFKALGEAGITIDAYGSVTPGVREGLAGLVNFKPPMSQENLLEAIYDYDFNLLPYAQDDFSKWISPAKYFEVVALCKPILTRSNLSHMPGWSELTFNIDLQQGALRNQLYRAQVEYSTRGLATTAEALARENTWTTQLALIETVISNA